MIPQAKAGREQDSFTLAGREFQSKIMEGKKDLENDELRQVRVVKFYRVIGTDGIGGAGVGFENMEWKECTVVGDSGQDF